MSLLAGRSCRAGETGGMVVVGEWMDKEDGTGEEGGYAGMIAVARLLVWRAGVVGRLGVFDGEREVDVGDDSGPLTSLVSLAVDVAYPFFSLGLMSPMSAVQERLEPRRLWSLEVMESKERLRRRLMGPERDTEAFRLREEAVGVAGGGMRVLLSIIS